MATKRASVKKRPPSAAARRIVTYELTPDEKRRAQADADAAGQTLSVWVGRVLRSHLAARPDADGGL